MHGGLKIYRGAAAAARNYVEADRSRADDYYLAEGSGHAELYVARRQRSPEPRSLTAGSLDGDAYEAWVAGYDARRAQAKGRLRTDDQGVRFAEVAVNGPKTWSLVAALHPESRRRTTRPSSEQPRRSSRWIAEHATTRVGPRGLQVQVPVDEIEAVIVRHYTSRAGDPHRHLHLQINARVRVGERWRGLHTVGVRDSLGAINGIGHAAVMCDPEFRAALAAHGYTLDPKTGEVVAAGSVRRRASRHAPGRSPPTSTGTKPSGAPSIRTRSPAASSGGLGPSRLGRSATRQGGPARRRRARPALDRGAPRSRLPATRRVDESTRRTDRSSWTELRSSRPC